MQYSLRVTLRACRSALTHGKLGTIGLRRGGNSPRVSVAEVLRAAGIPFSREGCQAFVDANTGLLGARAKEVFARPAKAAPKAAPKAARITAAGLPDRRFKAAPAAPATGVKTLAELRLEKVELLILVMEEKAAKAG